MTNSIPQVAMSGTSSTFSPPLKRAKTTPQPSSLPSSSQEIRATKKRKAADDIKTSQVAKRRILSQHIQEKLNESLVEAFRKNEYKRSLELIEEGADPDTQNPQNGDTALISAIRLEADKETLFSLIDKSRSLNTQNHYGFTALHQCLRAGAPEGVIGKLIESGADCNIKSWGGLTAFQLGNAHNKFDKLTEEVKLLIDHTYDLDEHVEHKSPLLHNAIQQESFPLAYYLLQKGANPNLKSHRYENTALALALCESDTPPELLDLLYKKSYFVGYNEFKIIKKDEYDKIVQFIPYAKDLPKETENYLNHLFRYPNDHTDEGIFRILKALKKRGLPKSANLSKLGRYAFMMKKEELFRTVLPYCPEFSEIIDDEISEDTFKYFNLWADYHKPFGPYRLRRNHQVNSRQFWKKWFPNEIQASASFFLSVKNHKGEYLLSKEKRAALFDSHIAHNSRELEIFIPTILANLPETLSLFQGCMPGINRRCTPNFLLKYIKEELKKRNAPDFVNLLVSDFDITLENYPVLINHTIESISLIRKLVDQKMSTTEIIRTVYMEKLGDKELLKLFQSHIKKCDIKELYSAFLDRFPKLKECSQPELTSIDENLLRNLLPLLYQKEIQCGLDQNVKDSFKNHPNFFLIRLALDCFISKDTEDKSAFSNEDLFKFLRTLTPLQMVQLFSHAVHLGDKAISTLQRGASLQTFEIKDGGHADNTWEDFMNMVLEHSGLRIPPHPLLTRLEEMLTNIDKIQVEEKKNSWIRDLQQEGWEHQRNLGRTELWKRADGTFMAIKWQKENEDPSELKKEYVVADFLGKFRNTLGLRSHYPKPVGVFKFPRLPHSYLDRLSNIKCSRDHHAYVYTFSDERYFTYLHDLRLSDEQFEKGRSAALHDVYTLAGQGFWMTSLADLFHNTDTSYRDDKGRYLPFPSLMFPGSYRDGRGSGRIHAWQESARYINERASGLADVGDSAFQSEFTSRSHPLCEGAFSGLYNRSNFSRIDPIIAIMTNFLGEYMLIDELLLGKRVLDTEQLDWESKEKTNELSTRILDGIVLAHHAFTGFSERVIRKIYKSSIDFERYAKQMAFWMQNGERGYAKHIEECKIPEGIFDNSVNVSIQPTANLRGWQRGYGFVYNGVDPDLGTVNGPYPIKEGERTRYLAATLMIMLKEANILSKEHLKNAEERVNQKKPEEARLEYEKALMYTPFNEKIHTAIAQIHQSNGDSKWAEIHKKQAAALKIQHWWDKKKDEG